MKKYYQTPAIQLFAMKPSILLSDSEADPSFGSGDTPIMHTHDKRRHRFYEEEEEESLDNLPMWE